MADISSFPGVSYNTQIDSATIAAILNNPANTNIEITGFLDASGGSTSILIDNPNLVLSDGGSGVARFKMYMPTTDENHLLDPGVIVKVGFKKFNEIHHIQFESSLGDHTSGGRKTGFRFIWGSSSTVSGYMHHCTFKNRPFLFGDRSSIYSTVRTLPEAGATYNILNNDYSNVTIEDCTFEFGWFGYGNHLTMTRCTQQYGTWMHGTWGGSYNTFDTCSYYHVNKDGKTNNVYTACKFYPTAGGRSYKGNRFIDCNFEGAWEEMVGNDGAATQFLTIESVGTDTIQVVETPYAGEQTGNSQTARPWGLASANSYIGCHIAIADMNSGGAGRWFEITGYNSGTRTFTVTPGKIYNTNTDLWEDIGTLTGLAAGDKICMIMGFVENEYIGGNIYLGYAPPSMPEGTNVGFSHWGGALGNHTDGVNIEYKHGLTTLPTYGQWGTQKGAPNLWELEIYPSPPKSTMVPQTPASLGIHEYSMYGSCPSFGNIWENITTKDIIKVYEYAQHFSYPHDTNGSYEAPWWDTQADWPYRGGWGSKFIGHVCTGYTWNDPKLPSEPLSFVADAQQFTWLNNDHLPDTTYSGWLHGRCDFSPYKGDSPAFLSGVQVYPYFVDRVMELYGESYGAYDEEFGHNVYTDPSAFDNYAFDWQLKNIDGSAITLPAPQWLNDVPIWGMESTTTFTSPLPTPSASPSSSPSTSPSASSSPSSSPSSSASSSISSSPSSSTSSSASSSPSSSASSSASSSPSSSESASPSSTPSSSPSGIAQGAHFMVDRKLCVFHNHQFIPLEGRIMPIEEARTVNIGGTLYETQEV